MTVGKITLPSAANNLQLSEKKEKKEQNDLQYNCLPHFKGKLFHLLKRRLVR